MRRHVEKVARELLVSGWRPRAEECFVASGDGIAPRLVDYQVWLAMKALLALQQPASRDVRSGAK